MEGLAFSTVLLFISITPGLIARFCYFTHPFANDARSSELINEVFWSLIPGLLIQLTFAGFLPNMFGYKINFSDVGFLLIGAEDNKKLNDILQDIQQNIYPIIIYNLFLLCISAILGFSSKWFVRGWNLDKKYEFFRFSNKWYYIMSGELLDTDSGPDSSADITLTTVDLLCGVGDQNYLYKGQLVTYYLNRSGELDGVLIRYPMRRKLEDDNKDDAYYAIPSNLLYIPAKEIININVTYFMLD